MADVVIISKNRDFAEVILDLAERELGIICHVAADEKSAEKWPDALYIREENQPIKLGPVLKTIREFSMQKPHASGPFRFDSQQKTLASQTGKSVLLTEKETQLFSQLSSAIGKTIDKDDLLKSIWGAAATELESHTLETHIYRLRTKLDEIGFPGAITASGGGYMLEMK